MSSGGPPVRVDLVSDFGEGLNGIFLRGLNTLSGGSLLGFPPTAIFTILALVVVIWLTRKERSARYLICMFGPVALVGGLTFLGGMVEIPLVSAFRWDTLYVCVAVLFALFFAIFQAKVTTWASRLACLVAGPVLILAVAVGAGSAAQRSMEDLDVYGGWATLSNYPQLADLAENDPLARAASLPGYRPKPLLGPHYGLDVVDGMRANFTWRRTGFWFETLPATPNPAWHTHRQVLGRNLEQINLNALRMIGDRYLLSFTALNAPELKLMTYLPGLRLADMGGLYELLQPLFPALQLAPELFVYRLDGAWDRVFTPTSVIATAANDFELDYFTQLRDLPRHTVLVPANAPDWLAPGDGGHVSVIGVTKTNTGIDIETGGEAGFLVYNQEPADGWRAVCGEADLPLAAVNAIMMIISVPAGCTDTHFIHDQ